ncbi:hypothetical protein [Gorillibacterium sp. sgz5001074]|uniref:hypothetical protein n=1 Tax=Gorillibacterium sp. sgz5001074 TaxID=3446695 RepID=UPI003F67F227
MITINRLSDRQRYLIEQSMGMMDALYDDTIGLLRDEEREGRHNTRSSAHYALGLLIRGGPGDLERADRVLHRVMDMQYLCPEEIYHGTFRVAPQVPDPPAGSFPWKSFAPGFAYFWNDTLEKIAKELHPGLNRLVEPAGLSMEEVRETFLQSAYAVIPQVWRGFDPNWREFIACTFAVILDEFEGKLRPETLRRMESSMTEAVGASIDRRLSDAIPMNSNIELMHLFIVHYYGHRLGNQEWLQHLDRTLDAFLEEFREFGSLAEFNTTTYYGVDLTVLGLWRVYGRTEAFREAGSLVERGLWTAIADFYNPRMENLSGPFARAYEMEMTGHSSIGVFLYLLFGDSHKHLAGINCETSHDPLIALAGVQVPPELLSRLREHQGDRRVEWRFRELCERDHRLSNRNLCTAAAWIGGTRMIGAMSGSRNTNGQMHPATIHWLDEAGRKHELRLVRREKGKSWNSHLRGIRFEASVEQDRLDVEVHLDTETELEVYFDISGPGSSGAAVTPSAWFLPGLACQVEADAPEPVIHRAEPEDRLEIIYPYHPDEGSRVMHFTLRMDPERERNGHAE